MSEPTIEELRIAAERSLLVKIARTDVAEKAERWANAYALVHVATPTDRGPARRII